MVLVLATHTVHSPSATVPFSIILLQDSISTKKVPSDFRCRQLIPTSGQTSSSLWDVPDATLLKNWLDEAINVDVTHAVFEVQEEFAIGLGEVVRARAAEKVAEGTKEVAQKTGHVISSAASAVGQQAIELDHRLRLSERATAAGTAIKDSAVGRTTATAFGRVGSAVSAGTRKVLDNEKVKDATGAVSGSFKKLGQSLSSLTGRRGSANGSDGVAPEHVPQFIQDDYHPQQPYEAPEQPAGAASLRNPAAVASAPAANGSSKFTLDDSESKSP